MASQRGPWTVFDKTVRFESAWLRLDDHNALRPDGAPTRYGVVHFKNTALGVLPVFDNGDTILIGQHRFPSDRYGWEIPEGGGDPQKDPEEEARRELEEEAGVTARKMTKILDMDMSNSVTDEIAVGYIATGLETGTPNPDPSEVLDTRRIPFRELLRECQSGQISDSLTLVMVFKAYYMAREGLLEPQLAHAMLQG